MIKAFKEIKTELENRRKKTELKRDGEGRVVVDLRVLNDDDFLSPYSAQDHNVLSEDVSGFIEKSLRSVPVEEQVRLRIHSDVITDEEKKEYTKAIHEHYADGYENICLEKRRLHKLALMMALVAVCALTLMIGLEVTGSRTAVLSEIIDIFAWVFMWEAVDIFFLECAMLRFKQRRYLALFACPIEYLPLEKDTDEK